MNRPVEPSQAELEYIFECMARGLSPTEIIEETQGTEFPARSTEYLSRKKMCFEAAKKILEAPIKSKSDGSLGQHWLELSEVANSLYSNLVKLKAIVIREKGKYGNAIDGGKIDTVVNAYKLHNELPGHENWRKLRQIDDVIAMRLLQHMKEEFVEFDELNDFRELAPGRISDSHVYYIRLVADRKNFHDSSCDWCNNNHF